jgi:hypothetical protein
MRWFARGLGLVAVSLFLAPSAAGVPDVDHRLRYGDAIGRVQLGMTLAQVRRVLGREWAVSKRERRSGRLRYLELQFDYSWWTVGLMRRANGEYRTVRIGTVARGQRTPERLGVGSTYRAVRRELRVSCRMVSSAVTGNFLHTECIYRPRTGRETAFIFDRQQSADNVSRVGSVEVRDGLFYVGWRVRFHPV